MRAGQKLHDPKVNIFNVALQNPILALDEPGRFLPHKVSNITVLLSQYYYYSNQYYYYSITITVLLLQ